MLSDRKYGLTMTILATRVLPVLIPQTVNPQLGIEQYLVVQSTIQDMFDHIDRLEQPLFYNLSDDNFRHQRNKLRLDGELSKIPECYRFKNRVIPTIKYFFQFNHNQDRQADSMSIPNLVVRRPSLAQVCLE